MDTVRIARDFGTVSELFPPGITDVRDLPHPLFDAIRRACMVIAFDDLSDEDRPPKRIWLDDAKLNAWFEEVRRRRKSGGGGGDSWDKHIEDPVQNAAIKDLIGG